MKTRPTQFGMRKNTASSRQHHSRPASILVTNAIGGEHQNPEAADPSRANDRPAKEFEILLNAVPQHAATAEEEIATNERSAQSIPLRPSPKSEYDFEPLIGSPEAAKLLGNIHIKTLQRYARLGKLPGYQIGVHWYFRASELDVWLQSRINSNCQPGDRVDFTKEKTQ